jgi:hypothetical protein
MQKLTILILITLILSSLLYAEDEPILLDRDILYWRPAGPDIEVPDVFHHPQATPYSEELSKSPLFFPLHFKELSVIPDDMSISDLSVSPDQTLGWIPPALNTEVPGRTPFSSLGLSFSHPYGTGFFWETSRDALTFDLRGNISHVQNYPSWIGGSFRMKDPDQLFSAALSYRATDQDRVFSLINWEGSSEPFGLMMTSRAGFKSSSVLDLQQNDLYPSAGLTLDTSVDELHMAASLDGLSLIQKNISFWRITPEFSVDNTYPLAKGDFSFSTGLLTDLYLAEFHIQYFPEITLRYRNHGRVSVFLETSSKDLPDEEIYRFLTQEKYNEAGYQTYRWQDSRVGFHFTSKDFQGYTTAGFKQGDMPLVRSGGLISMNKTVPYAGMDITWQLNRGIVTELNSYADYQDKGKLRFEGMNRWIFERPGSIHQISVFFHGGNRELLRGYRNLYFYDSDLLAGIGSEIEFHSSLKINFYLDTVLSEPALEGGSGVSFSY